MTHRSEVGADTFTLIQTGRRVIEPRLYDQAHRTIKIGDLLLFVNRNNRQELVVKVVGLLRFASFKELFSAYPVERFGKSERELLIDMLRFYGTFQEIEHGVVGIKIHRLKSNKTQ